MTPVIQKKIEKLRERIRISQQLLRDMEKDMRAMKYEQIAAKMNARNLEVTDDLLDAFIQFAGNHQEAGPAGREEIQSSGPDFLYHLAAPALSPCPPPTAFQDPLPCVPDDVPAVMTVNLVVAAQPFRSDTMQASSVCHTPCHT